jgi:hypothetical protein
MKLNLEGYGVSVAPLKGIEYKEQLIKAHDFCADALLITALKQQQPKRYRYATVNC